MNPFAVTSLKLTNFRMFEEQEFKLNPDCTVFIGPNGSGKSTIVEALSLLPKWAALTTKLAVQAVHWDLALAHLEWDHCRRLVPTSIGGGVRVEPSHSFGVALHQSAEPEAIHADFPTNLGQVRVTASPAMKGAHTNIAEKPRQTLPLFLSFGARRLEAPPERDLPSLRGSRLEACQSNPGFIETANLSHWFDLQQRGELAELQRALKSNQSAESARNALLHAAYAGVRGVTGASDVEYTVDGEELELKFDGQPHALPFSYLSSGQQAVAALAADIAWRTIHLNPNLGDDALAKTPGVVVIDELELHLHPKWQRTVLPRLRATFPSLQFIVTTHSPQVVGSVDKSCVVSLSADGGREPDAHTLGRDSTFILRTTMGDTGRDSAVEELFARLDRAIDGGDRETAHRIAEELREKAPDDPDLVGIDVELELAAGK